MEIKHAFKSYSFVIAGNDHNPTVVTNYFLKESGIVDDLTKDIDRNNFIVTPALAQFTIKGKTSVLVNPNALTISSTDEKEPYRIGKLYCQTLKYIKAIGMGLNYDIEVTEYDFDKWFNSKLNTKNTSITIRAIDYTIKLEDVICNLKITKLSQDKAHCRFNYHHDLKGKALGEVTLDIETRSKSYIEYSKTLLSDLFENVS